MKITVIHGQNHHGSTYNVAKMLYDKLDGEVTEFFLPKDFNDFCIGCTNCFLKDEKLCPHYHNLEKITQALDEADVIILASPVYVYHCSAMMKALLDHYGYRWMVHRPNSNMFTKQAVCISTAAGAGMKSTNKDMADSLRYWGVGKIYKLGYAVRATSFNNIDIKIKNKIDNQTTKLAQKILQKHRHIKPRLKTRILFNIMAKLQRKGLNQADSIYWQEKGWTQGVKPYKDH